MKIVTFGYRYPRPAALAVPADVLLDARVLAEDPAEKAGIGKYTGLDAPVRDYLAGLPDVHRFIMSAIPAALALPDGGTFAVACHSGRHRSVYIAEVVARALRETGRHATVEHLDIDRAAGGPDDAPDTV
jgi:UPF0042 nucleotide-binding protein